MQTRYCGKLLVLAIGLLLLGFAASSVRAGDLVEAGKIKLIGLVKSVSSQKHTFILSAAGYADENSQKWAVFGKERLKTIIVPSDTCYIYAKGITEGQVSPGRLRVGMPVIVSASAAGAGIGKPVTAESVGLLVNGTAFDLVAYHHQLSGEGHNPPDGTDAQQGNAVSSGFDLAGLIDKAGSDLGAYDAALGQSSNVKDGQREYKGPVSGLKGVRLSEQFGAVNQGEVPKPVSIMIDCFFPAKGPIRTWKSALRFLGFSLHGVREGGNSSYDTEDVSLTGLPGFHYLCWTPANAQGKVTASGDEYTLSFGKNFK